MKMPPRQGHQKIRKSAPFDLTALRENTPGFALILANAIEQLTELPDFSDAKSIAVMTDFGGEHPGARFNTYSFLILAFDKFKPFEVAVKELRKKHGILEPYSEFRYKRLSSGARSRALPQFLQLVDSLIHGAVVTVAVEKQIDSLFGGPVHIEETLSAMGLGRWKTGAGEKVLRVCHSLAIFVSLLTRADQPLFWYCDNDAINETGIERSFEDTQTILRGALGMYTERRSGLIGVAKSFEGKSCLDDLLSVPDFAAGVVQDLLAGHETGRDIAGGSEKVQIMQWIARESPFLSKITIQIGKRADGELVSGKVDFSPVA